MSALLLVDRKVRLNPIGPADFVYPYYLHKTVRAPPDLVPHGIDWAQSRPKSPWPTKYGHLVPIAKLELSTEDVIEVLCEGESVAVATRALASEFKRNPNLTRAQVKTWCVEHGYELSDRVFQFRVWPRARAPAGLPENALPGRKKKTSRPS
jgi:hypothetical protein